MARQLGRISGPLLAENLLRNGVNLSFSNDRTNPSSVILHLDVSNGRIGINNSVPVRDFEISGTAQTSTLLSQTGSIADLDFSTGKIENLIGNIEIGSGSTVQAPRIQTENIDINDNNITTTESNSDLVFVAGDADSVIFDHSVIFDQDLTVFGNSAFADTLAETVEFDKMFVNNQLEVQQQFVAEAIKIDQNSISTTESNASLELSPGGTGSVEMFANTNISGNLHATGDITIEGNLILGDQDQDSVVFNAEITSNIVPDLDLTYSLGSQTQSWSEIKSVLLNGIDIETAAITVSAVDIGSPQGNTFYVAVNGDNSNRGDHQQGPWATLRYALAQADASTGGPVTIFVYPGEYEEELPLYVPPNVSVKGADIRNTVIKPDSSSQSEDVFLLDGETTITDITIRDFYYDEVNDKGYAFRFAEVASTKTTITSRSPYIQNVTVITKGSVTSPSDPRGFDSGDAGRGALVDGQYVDSASIDASMLFQSCTFITPNATALLMRNGVRVEWLNSFSYFADIGIHAVNGALGRLTNDGSTVRRGAEIRSIGSANVYGNRGAVADGDETLMYLIGHNFAYIGTGKDVSNDSTLVIEQNQTQELNSGKIYYTSTDARGNFAIGDSFFVDFDTGTTTISGEGGAVTGITSINISTGGTKTFIDSEKIETGNLRISGNTIQSLTGPLNFEAASGSIVFEDDIFAQQNFTTTGNFSVTGSLFTLGNEITDTVSFSADVISDVVPGTGSFYDLGKFSQSWKTVFSSKTQVDDIEINDNYITTTVSNADLELRANGSGVVLFDTNSVEFNQNLFVQGLSEFQNFNTNNLDITGTITQVGNIALTGNFSLSGNFVTDRRADFENIKIDGNTVSTIESNSNLELTAAGTGEIAIEENNLELGQNLEVLGTVFASNIQANSFAAGEFSTGDISVQDNFITTTQSNSNLELRANGLGTVLIPANDVLLEQDLSVNSNTVLNNTVINSNLTITGNRTLLGNLDAIGTVSITGNFDTTADIEFESIAIIGNTVRTQNSNENLELRAAGTGTVRFNDNFEIDQDLSIGGTLDSPSLIVNSSLDLNKLRVENNIKIDDNYIATTLSNSDLELRASGSGAVFFQEVVVDENSISTLTGNLILQPNSNNVTISSTDALVLPVGTTAQNTVTDGDLRYNSSIEKFQGRANGANAVFNGVYSDDFLSRVTVNDADNVLRFFNNNIQTATITDSLNLSSLQIDDININNNVLRTSVSNSDLEFRVNGSSSIVIDSIEINNSGFTNTQSGELTLASTGSGYWKVNGAGAVAITSGDSASRRSNPETGETRWNTQESYMEVYDGVNWSIATGTGITISQQEYDDLLLELTLIFG